MVLSRYQENNEILIFWTNGIRKISFINFIGKVSILFVIFQLLLNMYIVPYTQNLGQNFLKNSSIDFFPKLIQEKKFFNVMRNITIFVEDYKQDGTLNGIYIKEKINETDKKIIIVSKDLNLRLKANALGLQAEGYEKDRFEEIMDYKGWHTLYLSRPIGS